MREIVEVDGRRYYSPSAVRRLLKLRKIGVCKWADCYTKRTGQRIPMIVVPEYRATRFFDAAIVDQIASRPDAPPSRSITTGPTKFQKTGGLRIYPLTAGGIFCVTFANVGDAIGVPGNTVRAWTKDLKHYPLARTLKLCWSSITYGCLIETQSALAFIAAYRRRSQRQNAKRA